MLLHTISSTLSPKVKTAQALFSDVFRGLATAKKSCQMHALSLRIENVCMPSVIRTRRGIAGPRKMWMGASGDPESSVFHRETGS
jgi:hypothetical protein